jgi:hypothetical protein
MATGAHDFVRPPPPSTPHSPAIRFPPWGGPAVETRAEPRCIGCAAVWRNFSNRGPQAGADGEGSSRRRELRWRSRDRRRWESRYTVQQKMRRRSAVGAGWESVHIQRSLRGMSRSEGNWGPRFCSTAPAQHPPLPRHQISPVGYMGLTAPALGVVWVRSNTR